MAWQLDRDLYGPERPTVRDIEPLNRVFSESFTDRYRRDGLLGVRVPHLNPLIWRYALEDAGDGAMVWRDGDGELAGFNVVHFSGSEGWMGPLRGASRPSGDRSRQGDDPVGHRLAAREGGADDRPRDHASHYREHRVLQQAGVPARASHDHTDPGSAAQTGTRPELASTRGSSAGGPRTGMPYADDAARAGHRLRPRNPALRSSSRSAMSRWSGETEARSRDSRCSTRRPSPRGGPRTSCGFSNSWRRMWRVSRR